MFYGAKNASITVNDCRMDYICFGTGSRPLVIVPGLGFQRLAGKALPMAWAYRLFARFYRVYVFERKLHISQGYSIEDMADELAQALTALQIETADVVGVSQGGMIAQVLASRYPKLVGKLVLVATSSRANRTVKEVVGNWIHLAKEKKRQALMIDMLEKVYSDKYRKKYRGLVTVLSIFLKTSDLERFMILATSILGFDCSNELSQITCPVLVLGGAQDQVVGPYAAQELVDVLASQSYSYEKLGHSIYEEAKDFQQRLLEFLLS